MLRTITFPALFVTLVALLSALPARAAAPAATVLGDLPATFVGDLPCADCPALRYHLDLLADGTYFLRRTYVDRAAVSDESGTWLIEAATHRLRLQSVGKLSEQFDIVDEATLRMLARSGNSIDSKFSYDLKRQPTFAPIEPSSESRGSDAGSIEDRRWRLVRLGGEPVKVTEPMRAPDLVLHADVKRMSGSGGCNRLLGNYSLQGERLTFGQIASTMMACPQGMEQERAYAAALERTARWRMVNEELELLDSSGASLAQFEAH